jgi:cation/acetate symporter
MKYKLGWLGNIPPKSEWWFGISPEGFGSIAMICNFIVSIVVSKLTNPPPKHVVEMVDNIRIPETI